MAGDAPRVARPGLAARVAGRARRTADARIEAVADWTLRREEARLLDQVRGGRDVCWPEAADDEPLVTVRIATFDRGSVVAERALASACRQTYERLEILVVGDAATPATVDAVRSVADPRVRFVNLPTQGIYPPGRTARHKVAGSHPMNVARHLARGQWLAPCDDDDELTDDHVEVLVRAAIDRRLEMVWSRSRFERSPGAWTEVGTPTLTQGQISHGSVLYSSGLRFMAHSNTSWKRNQPSDWNLWCRMRAIGVRMGFVDAVTYLQNLPERHRPPSA
jgi:hypothetical protein